jgi:hypothetical protein
MEAGGARHLGHAFAATSLGTRSGKQIEVILYLFSADLSRDSFQRCQLGAKLPLRDSSVLSVSPITRPLQMKNLLSYTGVGAIFYTQVALEVIPNDGSRDRLRA